MLEVDPTTRSNKPMVPTAPASPAANPSCPLRRHIGQPLDSRRSRVSGEQRRARIGPRTVRERTVANGQRAREPV